jgi:CheY-like chemotaxis protein
VSLLLDLDGTLLPSTRAPLREPDPDLCEILAELVALPGIAVTIHSDRAREDLERLFASVPELGLIADNGAWRRRPGSPMFEPTTDVMVKANGERSFGWAFSELADDARLIVIASESTDPTDTQVTMEVGAADSRERQRLPNVAAVRAFLRSLIDARRNGAREFTPGVISAPASGRRPVGQGKLAEGLAVLVVEDDEDLLALQAAALEKAGAHVWTATNGHDALSILRQHMVDVIVSDIGLPGMDGFGLLRRIRNAPDQRRQLPALAVTGRTDDETIDQAFKAGFQVHAVKPLDGADLVLAVAALGRMSPRRRA